MASRRGRGLGGARAVVLSKLLRHVIRTQREIADLLARFQKHLRSIFSVKDEETSRDEAKVASVLTVARVE
jgi:hypothetical protein